MINLPDIHAEVSLHENATDDTLFEVEFSAQMNGNWLQQLVSWALKNNVTFNMMGDVFIPEGTRVNFVPKEEK